MNNNKSDQSALETIALSAERLKSLSMPTKDVEQLLDMVMLAACRERLGEDRPTLVGFIGCTGTGKSTIFNSLLGKAACITGWKAHNTAGPVLLSSEQFVQSVRDIEDSFVPVFLTGWQRDIISLDQASSEAGAPGSIRWLLTSNGEWSKTVLFDLPDINTTRSLNDNLLALTLLPWLDTVVFVVDEETLYHRDYEAPVALSKKFQQRRLCVINNRGRDRIELDHPDLKNVKTFFGVDTIHVLPDMGSKLHFDNEIEFLRFRDDLALSGNHAPVGPIKKKMAPAANKIVEENERRSRVLYDLERQVEKVIQEQLTNEKPISIQSVLNEEAQQVLEHLGLKRFSISNMMRFFKRVTSTGALRRSFKMAFGNQRDDVVSQLLRLDKAKLDQEVISRLSDHRETIRYTIQKNPDSSLFKETLASYGLDEQETEPQYAVDIQKIVETFEQNCRDLISSDTISASLKNEPFLVVVVAAVLIADVLTIPGFGSWVFVPSIFKFLPLGKFEKTKRSFQQQVRDVIRETLMNDIHRLQNARRAISLETKDPLLNALKTCADNYEN